MGVECLSSHLNASKICHFLTQFDEYVLGCEKDVGDDACKPAGEQDDKIIMFLFVHGACGSL